MPGWVGGAPDDGPQAPLREALHALLVRRGDGRLEPVQVLLPRVQDKGLPYWSAKSWSMPRLVSSGG
ncbi:hypothetical protein P8A22_34175 [Streptomyces laculatispora]|uniref:Transposase n=1 Tax=Streptomyces laculatispora TaxID=887464 RepID=A0ABY9ICA4_9ACTN|nr:hypothetical protein [Streptomyces laculatispora]WLQ44512.1 hypothetical protein P8A22_34175 [Streptomyces laculatispora]